MMMILSSAESWWFLHLFGRLHPLVVHFPVALLCVALLLEAYSWKQKNTALRSATGALLWIGAVSALLSVALGLLLATHEGSEGTILEIHRWAGIATAVLSVLTLYLFRKRKTGAYRLVLAVTVGGVTLAGHYGAMLTHGEDYLTSVLPGQHNDAQSPLALSAISLANPDDALTPQQVEDINLKVRAIFAHNCNNCHGEAKKKGGLRLDSKDAIFAGGDNGPVILPGQTAKSELLRRITLPVGHKEAMPTKGKRLSQEEVDILTVWVQKGAPWPEGKEKSIYRVADLEPRLPQIPQPSPEASLPIDRFVNVYFGKHHIAWATPVEDRLYIRRVFLDVIGLLPSPEETDRFISDSRTDKRQILVRQLLQRNDDYAQHWITFWNDLLRNDYTGTGYITKGRFDITRWLYAALQQNKPYNWFVKELISPLPESAGFIKGIKWRGTINSSQRTEMQAAQNVAQVFLGLNLKCASCHDSFISDLKLEDAYGFANIFADSTLEINRCDVPTGKMAASRLLFPELGTISADAPTAQRLQELADYLVQPRDGRLYRTLVNRIWAQLMGRGIVEPVDVMDNLPWSQDLLDWLAYDFVENGYDIKRLMYQILTSRTYQLPSVAVAEPAYLVAEDFRFRGMVRRRLSAEQFADAVSTAFTPVYPDSLMALKRLPEDIRERAPFPRASLVINDQFLTALGRPNRETVSTGRISQANLLQTLELTNGTRFYETLKRGSRQWKEKFADTDLLIRTLYRNAYGRQPLQQELEVARRIIGKKPDENAIQDLVWAVALSHEFQLIY